MVKPEKTFTFFIFILLFLGILTLIYPKSGIKIGNDITLHFPDLKDFITESFVQTHTTEDSSKAIFTADNALTLIESDTLQYENPPADTTAQITDTEVFVPRAIATDSLRQALDLPASGLECLSNLFNSLIDAKELQKIVRIVHYGDSQIETDRITNYLRYKLQQQFGGSGPGLVPAKTAYDYKSPCEVKNIGKWKRYTIFPNIDTAVKHSKYGVLGAFCTFGPLRQIKEKNEVSADSLFQLDSLTVVSKIAEEIKPKDTLNAALKFIPSTLRKNLKDIKKCRLFYGNTDQKCNVKVLDLDQVIFNEDLKPTDFYTYKTFNFETSPTDLKFEFSSLQSPEIYGFALDGHSGVAVDNVALRGCSGTIFTKINAKMLAQMYNDLNVKCVILQFGGNAVPYMTQEKLGGFKSAFASQIRYIKKLCPKMSIIVVGPADMSTKDGDKYKTYDILPPLVDALKSAALSNGCAFWNMYEAMGGENTMPDWVYHEPQLAEKDFVHFTPNGANIMARMLYTAIISRYNEFLRKK